jgi:hypothetical protein
MDIIVYISPVTAVNIWSYLYFPYCISLIYFSFTKIRMFLYAQIYWLAEFGDVSCLQFNYLRVETLTLTWEDFVRRFCRTILRVKSDKTLCSTWEYDCWYTWRDLYISNTHLYTLVCRFHVNKEVYLFLNRPPPFPPKTQPFWQMMVNNP